VFAKLQKTSLHLQGERHRYRAIAMFSLLAGWLAFLGIATQTSMVWWTPIAQRSLCAVVLQTLMSVGLYVSWNRVKRDDLTWPWIHDLLVVTWDFSGMVAFSSAVALVSTLLLFQVTIVGLPLQDSVYSAIDRAILFPQSVVFSWCHQAGLIPLLQVLYASTKLQFVWMAFFMLLWVGRTEQFWRILAAISVGGMLTAIPWYLAPAVGPMGLGPTHYPAEYIIPTVQIVYDLKAGLLTRMDKGAGLLGFHSFHTVFSLCIIWLAARHRPWIWVFLPLNVLVLLATWTVGGHYLADLLGGAVWFVMQLALVTWVERHLRRRGERPHPP